MKMTACVCLLLVTMFLGVSAGQDLTESAKFRDELSNYVLQKADSVQLPSGLNQTVALAPIGAPFALGEGEKYRKQFDYPVTVQAGVVLLERRSGYELERIWQRVLSSSLPALTQERQEDQNSFAVLYRPTDRVDMARGLGNVREPSEKYIRYGEFKSAFDLLAAANDSRENRFGDGGAWRLHPRFQRHASLSEARKTLLEEWDTFGYRGEVEAALDQLKSSSRRTGWDRWAAARDAFDTNSAGFASPELKVGFTSFFPREEKWSTANWKTTEFTVAGNKVWCQILVVEIDRPWLDLSLVCGPAFRIRSDSDIGVVSTGAPPTPQLFPRGEMANIIDKIILVRNIQRKENTEPSLHPLMGLEPFSINLVGYVITSLPRIGVFE